MSKLKNAAYIVIFLIFAVLIESFSQSTGIPVTLLDIIFLPACVFLILWTFWYVFFSRKPRGKPIPTQPISVPGRFGVFFSGVGMLALGSWCTWAGTQEPGKYYSGVKGAMHGYTLVPLGLCIAGFGVLIIWQMVKLAFYSRV